MATSYFSTDFEWSRHKKTSVGTATTDCMFSIPSTIIGIGFFIWSLVLYNTLSENVSSPQCPMGVLRTLVLTNGIIDLAFPMINLVGKSLKLFEIGYREHGQPGPLNVMFEGIRGCGIGVTITGLVLLLVTLFGANSSYCPILNRGAWDMLRTFAIVNVVVNGLGMVISTFMGCMGITSGFWPTTGYYRPLETKDVSTGLYQSATA